MAQEGAAAGFALARPADGVAHDEGNVADWGDHVTDEEYAKAPPIDE